MVCKNFILLNCNANSCSHFNMCVISNDTRPIIKCSENRKSYTLNNANGLLVQNYHIDSGVIKDANYEKCDYAIHIPQKDVLILIELKGTSYLHAIEQITSTIRLCSVNFKNKRIYARIISQGVPNIQNDSKCINLKKLLLKTNGNLKSHTNCLIEEETKM